MFAYRFRSVAFNGGNFIPSWDPEGKMLWVWLCMTCFRLVRSDEMFVADYGAVHSVHCLTRDAAAFTPVVRSWNTYDNDIPKG